jgi:uncharacterized protein (TIGR02145 family)
MKTTMTMLLLMLTLAVFSQETISKRQCQGVTQKAVRCKNQTLNLNQYCYLHQGQFAAPTQTPVDPGIETVVIGTQEWMVYNLNVGTMIDAEAEQTDNNVIEKWCYDNLETNCTLYGGLYSWSEAMQYLQVRGSQGLCPSGFHVPTEAEWDTLAAFAGGLNLCANKLRETGFTHWLEYGPGGSDIYGFKAVAGGYRYKYPSTIHAVFGSLQENAYWHTSTMQIANDFIGYPIYKTITYYMNNMERYCNWKNTGNAIRCIKD